MNKDKEKQKNITIIPAQENDFYPSNFFGSEPKSDDHVPKKLYLHFILNPNIEPILLARMKENRAISGIAELTFCTASNKIFIDDEKIFGSVQNSTVTIDELLWVWKYLFRELARNIEVYKNKTIPKELQSPIQRTGLANIWKVCEGDQEFKAFFCMSPATNDIYLHTKKENFWTKDHKFFLKKS